MSAARPDSPTVGLVVPVANPASTPEPTPIPNNGASLHDIVIADMEERKRFGLEKYGTILQAHNGRDPLTDGYQEILDLAVYTRQAIIERDALVSLLRRLFQLVPPDDMVSDLDVGSYLDIDESQALAEFETIIDSLVTFAGGDS